MSARGKQYTWYEKRIIKKYPLARTFLETGMMLELEYIRADKTKKKYICILLHKGSGIYPLNEEMKMHLFFIENLLPVLFKDLVTEVGLTPSKYFTNVRKFDLEKLLTEQKDAKQFYLKTLKPHLNNKFNDTYRTFNIGTVIRTQVIDFDFDKI